MALTEGTNCGFVTTAPTSDPGGTNFAVDTTAQACKFTSPQGAFRIVEMGFWVDNATEAANFDISVYSHNAGSDCPDARLSSTGLNVAKGTDAGWKVKTGLSITITESTTYWLGVQVDDTATATNSNYTTSASYKRDYKSSQTSLPSSWGASTGTAGEIMAIYAVVSKCVYNETRNYITYLYRATSGGTVFSANLSGTAAFDYFDDAPVANDAIYFGGALNPRTTEGTGYFSDLDFNIGTALSGTDVVLKWEYYNYVTSSWADMAETDDDTAGFTATGAQTFKFPWQYYQGEVAVNSVTVIWVRCRLHSFTAMVEGGANQTTGVKTALGYFVLTGSSDAVPASFSDLMTYMNTYYPYITSCVKQDDNVFRFPNVGVVINSRLLSTNEYIFLKGGQRFVTTTAYNLSYLTSGTLSSNLFGYDGSTIEFWDNSSWYCGYFYTTTYLYGSVVKRKTAGSGVTSAYLASYGFTGYDTTINSAGLSNPFANARTCVRCTFIAAGNIIVTAFATQTFTNVLFGIVSGGPLLYNAHGNFDNCWFKFGTYNFTLYQTNINGLTWYLRDPLEAFPVQNPGTSGIIRNETSGGGTNWSKVWFYDDSASSYTDITNEMISTAADDVNLYGDVGDIFYFCFPAGVARYGPAISVTATNASNDNTYLWELYGSTGWVEFGQIWDNTNNFTTNQLIYFRRSRDYTTTTINGTNGYWIRLRITGKGADTPKVSRITYRDSAGTTDWQFLVQYSAIVKVIDTKGQAIGGATVKFTDVLGTTTTLTTDSSGLTTSTYFTTEKRYFDPTTEPFVTYYGYNVASLNYNPYTITISKSGYVTKKTVITFDEPQKYEIVALENRRNIKGKITTN